MGFVIFSGFPGVGKSYAGSDSRLDWVCDLDGSCMPRGCGDEWVVWYVDDVEKMAREGRVLLVSWHERVRAELCRRRIPFVMVYPDERLKEEYLGRYRSRGSSEGFIYSMEANWNDFR